MLRQILSPSSENEDLNYTSVLQQPSALFNAHASVLSSTLQMPSTALSHHQLISLQDQQAGYHEHVQILTETHPCPHCGLKLTYHVRTTHAHRDQVDQLLDVGVTQLVRFTCHACSRSFLAQSHMKFESDQQLPPPPPPPPLTTQQQIIHISPTSYQTTGQLASTSVPNTTGHDKSFSCDRCQASFRYRTLLEKHKKMHDMGIDQNKPYSCPRCLMRFETRNQYNHHAKTHKPMINQSEKLSSAAPSGSNDTTRVLFKSNNSYTCEICAKEFPSVESLTSHKAVHRSRPLICDVCGKGFTHRKYYVVHQRIHTGERPYLCAMCGKSFTQASTLTVHRRYHTGERPYTCTLCGKGFVTRTIMLNHMKKH